MSNNPANNQNRKSVNLLPTYFQTEKNSKFLSSTLDPLYQVPELKRISGFVGSKITPTYDPQKDVYIPSSGNALDLRNKYPLQPALTIRNVEGTVTKALGFDDLVNQLSIYESQIDNFNDLFKPKFAAYDPQIDWDKFVNFREYYWLPTGPDSITVTGLQQETVSTYTVTDTDDQNFFVFTPDGVTTNPLLTFYKGITYVLNVNTQNKFFIKFVNQSGDTGALAEADGVLNNGITNGQIIFTVPDNMPGQLYYASDSFSYVVGTILVRNIEENSQLDVVAEILGKSQYRSAPTRNAPQGIEFINGLKVRFAGNVTPQSYLGREFIVEGVGQSIELIDYDLLQTPDQIASLVDDDFDIAAFDEFPFDSFDTLPLVPEYVTINRASQDLNPWSRYNRWFHQGVLAATAQANGVSFVSDLSNKARRPIVEFRANLQLYNFGNNSIDPIDLIDFETADVFSSVEKAVSYAVDGVPLVPGQRVIFNADPDPLVRGKVFQVNLATINGQDVLNLIEEVVPQFGNSVVTEKGNRWQGIEWWFNGQEWVRSQQRTRLNQSPLFDLFNEQGNSYSDRNVYNAIFTGNKLFGYAIGSGPIDPVLGFSLSYKNLGLEGSYLFENYFETQTISVLGQDLVSEVPTSATYLRFNNSPAPRLCNVWTPAEPLQLPVQQFQVVSNQQLIEITVYDQPAYITDLTIEVFVDGVKFKNPQDYEIVSDKEALFVQLSRAIGVQPAKVLINCYSAAAANDTGVYQPPVNLTNNPLNGPLTEFTLSEITDHVGTMAARDPNFDGIYPGNSNLGSLPAITKYGTRLISSYNPLAFASMFITNVENSAINAIRQAADDYYQFKLSLLKFSTNVDSELTSAQVLDQVLAETARNKNSTFPYAQSDMLGYGSDVIQRNYVVTDSRNVRYALPRDFDLDQLSMQALLIYLNNVQLTHGRDYIFDPLTSAVEIKASLTKGDQLTLKYYVNTGGSYVPPTPTKLGLYPSYEPEIIIDRSYVGSPQVVIQGHDGSLTLGYTEIEQAVLGNYDYRDLMLVEYEKRIYNNLKTQYNPDLINVDNILPSVFRSPERDYYSIFDLVQKDFVKWTSAYGVDYITNNTYSITESKTYNYRSASDQLFNSTVPGHWRGIYKYYFDTDRPDTCPWEMLGFTVKPEWWDQEYGPAPYTSGNLNLWQDLERGMIRQGPRAGIDLNYARPGLAQIIPVNDSGQIIDIRNWGTLGLNGFIDGTEQNWKFGDHGPAETAWRRSSLWPYAIQIIMALTKPADYASMMFDPFRLTKDVTGQYRYGPNNEFLSLNTLYLNGDLDAQGQTVLSSGYSVWVIENGKRRSVGYLNQLKRDLATCNFNLFYKAGGFLSKDKLDITVDSVSPETVSAGVLLPNEDYDLLLNVSNPVRTVSASGIIVERNGGKFTVRGYDRQFPYFRTNPPLHKNNDTSLTVGGRSPVVLTWTANTFYQAGQYIRNGGAFYIVPNSLNSGLQFNSEDYIFLSNLPSVGGATVLITKEYDSQEILIPYGTQYSTIQEVYDLIVGYGFYLGKQGFEFNSYNGDLQQVLDWKFTGKEFLFWTTQNWAAGAVITLSPFAEQLQFRTNDSVVDNIFNSFYDYAIYNANGTPFAPQNIDVAREDGLCTISAVNTADGFFYVRLNLIQKEHAIVMNNSSLFGDVIYDLETGYRQQRIKLAGFITDNWNGDYLSPGFIYDEARLSNWQTFKDYQVADVVKYSGKFYSANETITGTEQFDFNKWTLLGSAPVAQLLPNFDYKINQFEDFYSLDIDNFDVAQQQLAQRLVGYIPRPYLTNIIADPIAQYKFYQGFIKEKGTANAIDKLSKASLNNLNGEIVFSEEWAIRAGSYGDFASYNEIEFPLRESDFRENSQIIEFVDQIPNLANDVISYITPRDVTIKDQDYQSQTLFAVSNSSTYANNELLLPVAGYVRADDVTATAYSVNSLFDIADVTAIRNGDTIWVGFEPADQWNVYRYTQQSANVINSSINISGLQMLVETDRFHGLVADDLVAFGTLDNGTNGVYRVINVPSLTTFVVSTAFSSIAPSTTRSLLFKFISVRVEGFDDILELSNQFRINNGDRFWADNGTGSTDQTGWAVFERTFNFTTSTEVLGGINIQGQRYGQQVATADDADRLIVSAPDYDSSGLYGRISVFSLVGRSAAPLAVYGVNSDLPQGTLSQLGYSLTYDQELDIVISGAPAIDAIQINQIDRQTSQNLQLLSYTGNTGTRYGSEIYLAKQSQDGGPKLLLVAAPGEGVVYYNSIVQNALVTTTNLIFNQIGTIALTTSTADYVITGNLNGSSIAVSNYTAAATTGTGQINVYSFIAGAYTLTQTISTLQVDNFGISAVMSDDGQYLAISSDQASDPILKQGKVYVYKRNAQSQQFDSTPFQILSNPSQTQNMRFGTKVKFDAAAEILLVSASGSQSTPVEFADSTVFDGESTTFVDFVPNSGTVYSYERKNTRYIYACEVFDQTALTISNQTIDTRGTAYGESIALNNRDIFVGAPDTAANILTSVGTVHQFNRRDNSQGCWATLRSQSDTVDVAKINRTFTVDVVQQRVLDYLDIIDPIKGKIAGPAEQELKYKTAFDPAVYSIGTQAVVVNTDASWIEEHLGELWWDLSTVKYIWYEQGDLEYRKNSWGRLFPGASIDVYEWVSSEYLPSQWSALADTTEGLTKGISGQPRYPDNSSMSVKQFYNATTGQSTNIYFYWVKNKTTLPALSNRRISASEVAGMIFDPAGFGMRYIAVIAPNAIAATNVRTTLNDQRIHLNIAKEQINNSVNRHTEWILMGEGDSASMPSEMLTRKLINSLVGRDSLGNLVPDPQLSSRIKYGIQIRPRQSMFVNRNQALRNAIEYTNGVMAEFLISDLINFSTLNSKQEIPDEYSKEYDIIVPSYDDLLQIRPIGLVTAEIICTIDSSLGIVDTVNIVNSGAGYGTLLPTALDINGDPIRWAGPSVTIQNNGSGVEIELEINSAGSVTSATIINAGSGLTQPPVIAVRPYTAIVEVDENSNNRWAKYQLRGIEWVKIFTQDFNTTQYWDYVDWVNPDYDSLKPLVFTVDELYQLSQLQLQTGEYVKVNNQGNGRYVILKKVNANGTFDIDYDLMLSEKGTIRFSESLWNTVNNQFNFDYILTYDQSLYDQTPEKELINILNALKNDIFVGPLKVYWNLFFFKCVKYAFSEQKFLDWAFKTSLINVRNLAGALTQRPVYKFQNSQFYEDYIKEVKPYHTNIRNYQVDYTISEPSNTFVSDFDLPSQFNVNTQQYDNALETPQLLDQYPWKSWNENHTLYVDSIVISSGGSGYTSVPTVDIVPAYGDSGTGATAEARISLGRIVEITVTNSGSGYTKTPKVIVNGGGSTELVPAKAYPLMSNGRVRSTHAEIKFDRNSTTRQIGPSQVTDDFVSDGQNLRYTLSWASTYDKHQIVVVSAGQQVLAVDYVIETYTRIVNGYHKLFSDIVLASATPQGQILSVTYQKNINLYNAVDRIEDYYSPTVGMPGLDLAQLLKGIEYPGANIQGLPFDYSASWDMMPFGQNPFGDQSNSYTSSIVTQTTATGTTILTLDRVLSLSPRLRATTVVLDTSTVNENKFASSNVTVVSVNTFTNQVTFSTSTIDIINSGTVKIEFWDFNLTPGVLDTVIEGGDLSYFRATGSLPDDTIIDAETFISPNISHSPEELIKGQLYESLSLGVYVRATQGSPLITHTYYNIDQTTSTTTIQLILLPPNTASTMLVFDEKLLSYGQDYAYDYQTRTITIDPQPITGTVQVTVVGVGGTEFLFSDSTTVVNTTTISALVSTDVSNLGIYATLNGQELNSSQYTVDNGVLTVSGISTGSNLLQVWSYGGGGVPYSTMREQVIIADGVSTTFPLQFLPGELESPNSQAIVDVDGHMLIPPTTVYYSADGVVNEFEIDPYNTRPPGAYDSPSVEVFVNGVRMRGNIDYVLIQPLNRIEFSPFFLEQGDAIAITNNVFSDYYFDQTAIALVTRASAGIVEGSEISVISFNNSQSNALQTQVFDTRGSRRYPLSRSLFNDDYVWVTVGKRSLFNGIDYYLDDNGRTLRLRDDYPIDFEEKVVILSMIDIIAEERLGYRVFTDMQGRTNYRRISKFNSANLVQPLYNTSTEIVLDDASNLLTPDPLTRTLGIVFVEAERIEYLSISGNTLQGIRRATLGTGAKDVYDVGTTVYDQTYVQNMPYYETVIKQTVTATTATDYLINGISLSTGTAKDQLTVYYGGIQLSKTGFYRQNIELSYDQTPHEIIGQVSTSTSLPLTVVIGHAYVVTATNQVWIYTNSDSSDAVNGYAYTGLDYVEPQYDITQVITSGTVSTAQLELNLPTVTSGTNILIMQRVATNNFYANTQTSLLDDLGINANFLKDSPA